jgi:ketosteroid isomerase-like protein
MAAIRIAIHGWHVVSSMSERRRPPPACTEEETMSRTEIEQAIRDLYGARMANDVERARDWFAQESRFAINGTPDSSPIVVDVRGKAEIDHLLGRVFDAWEWLEQDIRNMLIDGDRAAVHYRLKARFVPSDQIIDTEICDLLTFQSGKLTEIVQFLDTAMAERLMSQP